MCAFFVGNLYDLPLLLLRHTKWPSGCANTNRCPGRELGCGAVVFEWDL